MRTACSSSCSGGRGSPHIPRTRHHPPWEQTPLGADPPWEQTPLGADPSPLGADPPGTRHPLRSRPPNHIPLNFPLVVGLETPPSQIPSVSPLVVGLETPPGQIHLNFSPGCGPGNLQCILGYQPPCGQNS